MLAVETVWVNGNQAVLAAIGPHAWPADGGLIDPVRDLRGLIPSALSAAAACNQGPTDGG